MNDQHPDDMRPHGQHPPAVPGADEHPPAAPDTDMHPPAAPGADEHPPAAPGADEHPPAAPGADEHRHTDLGALPSEPVEMGREEFEEAVGDALDEVPSQLMELLDNVVFFVDDEPPSDDPELLGVYDGIPLTERGDSWGGQLPDRITIFRGPILRMCIDRDEVIDEIAITVVHEIAHHFGIDDERLHALGWG